MTGVPESGLTADRASEMTLRVQLAFGGVDEAAISHPRDALRDVLELIRSTRPVRLDFVYRSIGTESLAELSIQYTDETRANISLIKQALVRNEARAGYNCGFSQSSPWPLSGWQLVRLICNDPAVAGRPFALPMALFQAERPLFRAIKAAGAPHGYAMSSRPVAPDLEASNRLAGPIAEATSLPGKLDLYLRQSLKTLTVHGSEVIEGICLGDDASQLVADSIEETMMAFVQTVYPGLPRDLFTITWDDLSTSVHPALFEDSVMDRIEMRRPLEYVNLAIGSALEHINSNAWQAPPKPPPPAPVPRTALAPINPAGPFAFLSYAHTDGAWVMATMARLSALGVNIWSDHGIEPGDAWDETLEDRIRECAFLIACVSPRYEASRYCRREIKFADVLAKPILPVSSQAYSWGKGLQFMFQELQVIEVDKPDALERVCRQILTVAPQCVIGRN